MSDVPAVPNDDDAEVMPLAMELAAAYRRITTFYRDDMQMSGPEADERARGADDTPEQAAADLARIRGRPPDQMSWFDLQRVMDRDPDAGLAIWRDVQAAAWDELASGHRTAQALDWSGNPWQRAQFLAIRDSFREDYQPRPGFEAAMVDMAAEAFGDYLAWTETVHRRAALDVEAEERDGAQHGHYQLQRVSWMESLEHAARMAERAHTRFLRTVKTLSDLRRAGPVFVGTAGQVNVASQQVNVSRPAPEGDE